MFEWAVVGAGPAGITSVGVLLEQGVPAKSILWIDPEFKVGDFGTVWREVDGNTRVDNFQQFLTACTQFKCDQSSHKLFSLAPDATCKLGVVADCLQAVTEHLRTQVHAHVARVTSITAFTGGWQLHRGEQQQQAKKVVLAMGAHPKQLPAIDVPIIPLEVALNPDKLAKTIAQDDVVAVFGNSHSGILALRDCLALGAQQVISFYRSTLRFALPMDDWILFDNTGLKGNAADWARQHLTGQLPPRLQRYHATHDNIERHIMTCTQAIHAVGFERRSLFVKSAESLEYNDKTGIIAPGLFGAGIAFPEGAYDPLGNFELNVGLLKFMTYLKRVIPLWLRYPGG